MRGNREVTISKINKDIALWYHTAEFGKVCTHFVFSLATGCLLRIVFFFQKCSENGQLIRVTVHSDLGSDVLLSYMLGMGCRELGVTQFFMNILCLGVDVKILFIFHLLFLDLFHLPLLKVKFQL